MSEIILSDYFYDDEPEQFQFFRIPRQLISNPKFKSVSTDAKLLYGMFLDRMSLSAKNDWYDKNGRVYIYYTVDEICEDMTCGRDKAMKLLSELDTNKGIGLIERVKQGQGRPTKIYVKRFSMQKNGRTMHSTEVGKSDVQKSDFSMSRSRENRCPEVGKNDVNYNNINQTDLSHNDPPILLSGHPVVGIEVVDRDETREEVKENIDYEQLQERYPYDDVESLLELIVDVLCSTAETMRIGGEILPAKTVKERFRKLDGSHIEYVIDSLKQTTTKINNIRAYLLTALYNAPVTIGPYYSAAVRHDFS